MEEKHNSPGTIDDTPPPSSTETPPSRRRGGGLKRKVSNFGNSNSSTPPTLPSSKRQAREKPSQVLFPPIHNGPCTRARQNPNYSESTSFWDAVVVKGEGDGSSLSTPGAAAAAVAKVEEELNSRKEAWEALEARVEAEYSALKARDANAHVAPISSGWFSWTKIHPLEERALPSFFNGKSEIRTPDIYMEIRNFILNKFHTNPNMQIEVKDLSEISIGELDARQEVMEFLDYWGLINYHPFPGPDTTCSMVDADEVAKVESLIQKLYQFETEQFCSPATLRTSHAAPTVPSRLLPESMIIEESVQPEGPSVEYHCNSCSADCSRKRYHCQKQADFDLCTECFSGRKFDCDMCPSDFILMEPADAAGASSGRWTDQETLLLLEALELFSENWNEIAEHVATKTKAQCILHFVQMPIEDAFMDCYDEVDANQKANAGEKEIVASLNEDAEKKVDVSLKEDADVTKSDTPSTVAPEMKETVNVKPHHSKDIPPPNDASANDDQPVSSPIDILEPVDPSKPEDNQEREMNIAVKALSEAFEAVGYLPSSEEKLSFADAGNPVMALVAFLGRLVDPAMVTALARNSLKSVSNNGSGLQLSVRHSFLIEDPTDESKKSVDTERDVAETAEREGLTDKTDSNGMLKVEKFNLINSDDLLNDHKDKENKDSSEEKKELLFSDEKDKDLVTQDIVLSSSPEKDENKSTQEKGTSISVEKEKDPVAEEKVHLTPSGGCTEKSGVATETDSIVPGEVKSSQLDESNSLKLQKEQQPIIAEEIDKQTSQVQDPSSSEKESKDSADGEAEAKDEKNEGKDPIDAKDDPSIHKIKRAAVTAIAAAAVKAKFLADQEEDQIQQLATSLIEKQLHKLEAKLTFFSEMDGVVARVREQMERSKQRLYHERAQIITARLGTLSSSSSGRPMPQSLPNRVAMAFPNAVPRPPNPMSMTPQRSPLSRPMMASTPPVSNPVVSATVAGNSVQISNNQDRLSTVGMK